MSDQAERRAERDGDAARAQRERCRRGEHQIPDGMLEVRWRSSPTGEPIRMFVDPPPAADYGNTCKVCGSWVPFTGTVAGIPKREPTEWRRINPDPSVEVWRVECRHGRDQEVAPMLDTSRPITPMLEHIEVVECRQSRPAPRTWVYSGVCSCGIGYRSLPIHNAPGAEFIG